MRRLLIFFRTQCDRPNMGYADRGSTVRDAKCRCNPGFHFRKGDHTLCIPNRECPIGYGQTDYGTYSITDYT